MNVKDRKTVRRLVNIQGSHIGVIRKELEILGIDFNVYEDYIQSEIQKKFSRVKSSIRKGIRF